MERNYHRELAHEVERLRAENEKLREAIKQARWWITVAAAESLAALDCDRCVAFLDAALADEPEALHYWAG